MASDHERLEQKNTVATLDLLRAGPDALAERNKHYDSRSNIFYNVKILLDMVGSLRPEGEPGDSSKSVFRCCPAASSKIVFARFLGSFVIFSCCISFRFLSFFRGSYFYFVRYLSGGCGL